MPVVTLTPTLLAKACSQLSQRVKAGGFAPLLIIGIQHGGAEVAKLMKEDFPDAAYCEVRLSRPDTPQKSRGWKHRLLHSMHIWLCNVLRIVESRVNEWRSKGKEPVRIGEIRLPEDIAALLSTPSTPSNLSNSSNPSPPSTVLLVDDAIDTGATIHQARQQLLEQFPDIILRVAVITVTTPLPICDADFSLYHNRTLCRFPWSNDYRSNSTR
ncbi:MAG: phosphoribosyltransferase [Bacteroidales bacterium]|nr:phosphoribosyltransferase [Bacteroidales bacterium]